MITKSFQFNSSPELSIPSAPLACARAARIAAAARASGGVVGGGSRAPLREGVGGASSRGHVGRGPLLAVLRRGGGGAPVEPGDPSLTSCPTHRQVEAQRMRQSSIRIHTRKRMGSDS